MWCMVSDLEKEAVWRVSLPTLWRRVRLKRSMWLVGPRVALCWSCSSGTMRAPRQNAGAVLTAPATNPLLRSSLKSATTPIGRGRQTRSYFANDLFQSGWQGFPDCF